jgi:hypothetical protein
MSRERRLHFGVGGNSFVGSKASMAILIQWLFHLPRFQAAVRETPPPILYFSTALDLCQSGSGPPIICLRLRE